MTTFEPLTEEKTIKRHIDKSEQQIAGFVCIGGALQEYYLIFVFYKMFQKY
jgi:hypothetical protein